MSLATLLVLADGRLPAGGHAHSGGLEAQVAAGRIRGLDDVYAFLRGRLNTGGLVAAAFAAAACRRPAEWAALDEAFDARTPSPALRKASRAQGRALLRAGRSMWPLPKSAHTTANPTPGPAAASPAAQAAGSSAPRPAGSLAGSPAGGSAPREMHQPIALGLLAAGAGLGPLEAAVAAAHGTTTGAASAAVRLLGLDPYAVHGLIARLAPDCDRIAALAARRSDDPVDDLPAAGSPLLDIGAEHHATWEVRLFAS
jgi:urease accessory protein